MKGLLTKRFFSVEIRVFFPKYSGWTPSRSPKALFEYTQSLKSGFFGTWGAPMFDFGDAEGSIDGTGSLLLVCMSSASARYVPRTAAERSRRTSYGSRSSGNGITLISLPSTPPRPPPSIRVERRAGVILGNAAQSIPPSRGRRSEPTNDATNEVINVDWRPHRWG